MTTNVKKYQVYCTTDNVYHTTWSDSTPTVCPNNAAHSINTDSIVILQSVDDNTVTIAEESVPLGVSSTGGMYCATTITVDVPAIGVTGEVTTVDHSFPFPISLINVSMTTCDNNSTDRVSAHISPDTIIGGITEDVSIGITDATITGFTVQQSVIDNIKVGYIVKLYNGVQNDLGYCVDIDLQNLRIKTELGTTNSFNAADPTYVQISVPMIQNFELSNNTRYQLARGTIGGSYVNENTIGRVLYQNWEGSAKKMRLELEYFY